jgi:hypothetical protein
MELPISRGGKLLARSVDSTMAASEVELHGAAGTDALRQMTLVSGSRVLIDPSGVGAALELRFCLP